MANRITMEEYKYLRENGLHILCIWISPDEGYEYRLQKFGTMSPNLNNGFHGEHALCYRKSERACFNFAKRLLTLRAPDSLKASEKRLNKATKIKKLLGL